ncbi:hypothetical protein AWRI1631_152520 [Saccharomyces cerevisiae AWRI1631]|uniref:YOR3162c protein n=2 Tax=Saccharomyces cerevisiae TaxID=4932 RepID=E9PAB3_YEASX|nr:hypothetical protein AWRI1631_152520 [Saccharomyces cerevisiae AWRI1631]CAA64013.1 YOR3162c [Saccharomyces cerevisiae]
MPPSSWWSAFFKASVNSVRSHADPWVTSSGMSALSVSNDLFSALILRMISLPVGFLLLDNFFSALIFAMTWSFFHWAKLAIVIGVSLDLSSFPLSVSINSSSVIFGCFSSDSLSSLFCSLVFSTKPSGRECLYIHLSPPLGQIQNQPYLPFSTASMKYLHTLSVVVFGLPCFDRITFLSFSSSQLSIVSFSFSLLVSWYKSFFSILLPTFKSCENLHLAPLLQFPSLNRAQTMDLGSTPARTLWSATGLNSALRSASSASLRFFSSSFFNLISSFLGSDCDCTCLMYFWTLVERFLFFIPNVLSTLSFFLPAAWACFPFFGGIFEI